MGSVSIQELGPAFVLKCFQLYWKDLYFFLAYAAGVLYLLLRRKKGGFFFFFYNIFLFLTVYNPLLVWKLYAKLDSDAFYYRFLWLLPVSLFLGYLCVRLISPIRKTALRAALAVLLAADIVVSGVPMQTLGELKLPSNVYRLSPDVFAVCEAIHSDYGSENGEPKLVTDLALHLVIRQYDASIRLCVRRDNLLYYMGSTTVNADESSSSYQTQAVLLDAVICGQADDHERLSEAIESTGTEYLAVPSGNQAREDFLAIGCTEVAVCGNYVLYRTSAA